MKLNCENCGEHEISAAQELAEYARCDSGWACHKTPGCPGLTVPVEDWEPLCNPHTWEWSNRDMCWWCLNCGESKDKEDF